MLRIADTFVIERPRTVEAALALLATHGERARLVAGGTDLLVNIKHGLHAPEVLVDLKAIDDLRRIDLDGDVYEIGALVGIHTLAAHPGVAAALPALAHAAGLIAGPQLRRMGTLGGNVCLDTRCVYINQTPRWREALGFCIKKDGDTCHVTGVGKKCVAAASNDTAPVLWVLGAEVRLVSPRGERVVPLDGFYRNDGERNTVLEPDEILTHVRIPRPAETRRVAYQKLRLRGAIDYPMLNLALAFDLDGGEVRDPALVISAIAARPRPIKRLPEGPLGDDLVEQFAELAYKQTRPLTNINADVQWRRDMVPVLVRRAFAAARGEPHREATGELVVAAEASRL